MSNPPTNNITTIPESPPPPPLPLLRRHSNPPPPHLEDPRQQFMAASNKYTTPSPSMVTTKLPIPPEARQDASYEPRTPPQEHRSLVSKDSHTNPGETNMMRQSLSWSSPTGRNLGKTSGSMDLASPVNGWPQRSPMNPEHDASDVASFALFTQSFDTISESGQQQQQHIFREEGSGLPNKIHLKARSSGNRPPLQQQQPSKEEVGNLSPIQLERPEGTAPTVAGPVQYPHSQPEPTHNPYRGTPPPYQEPPYHPYNGPPPPPYEEGYAGYPAYEKGSAPPTTTAAHEEMHHRSNPFFVLRTAHRAFWGCSYLLPCLENREVIPIHLGVNSSFRLLQDPTCIPDAHQVALAKRRVETAICTFGGYLPVPHEQQPDSIFRRRHEDGNQQKSARKQAYDDRFNGRYVVKPTHVEWKLEENPPIGDMNIAGLDSRRRRQSCSNSKQDGKVETEMVEDNNAMGSTVSVVTLENNQQKMKYRCKLCGQLKQNHNCPYQQSLQRSIGVMVYPAVNAYTASEPGQLTKPLSEMNNFVSYESSENLRRPYNVTPETKARGDVYSPSSLTTVDSMVGREDGNTPFFNRKRRDKKPFVKILTLRQEHYRAVAPMASEDGFEYQYPHVPLTFRERKRLSDTLFFLSKEIPDTTVPVASLLRTARERNEWDLCVAELLTQIVVALYCREGDHRLDGLQDYLLQLGVAC